MTLEIPDLWPPEVAQVKVLTPLLILRHQAGLLRQRSANLLEADVVTRFDQERHVDVFHSLDVIVPALDRLQVSLACVRHNKIRVYPAYLDREECTNRSEQNRCSTQAEFVRKLGELLGSEDTRSVIESLLAQANEAISG